ncbi:carcinoembryonic antigen-related cell adhesion molecule 1-like [Spea bombifrons]|uniref:carcinoembryonic antigen-related cell adhesion molecule 1-like n=1 Tax=Spea bombifrons TaxID=233779 RepID=UPI00234AB4B4|nr:carcinoembryonic antigen-related cell adhesion molecule 1-like [Spea bombifrons]
MVQKAQVLQISRNIRLYSMIRKGWTVSGVIGLKGWLVTVLLGLWMEPVGGIDIQLVPQYPAVGQSVTLSVTGITGTIQTFSWFNGQTIDAENQILIYFLSSDSSKTIGTQYFFRARGLPNGSLLMTDLLVTDRGYYTVSVQTAQLHQASVNLTVYEKVSKPVITASTSQPKENDPVTLTCDTVNAESIQWGRRGAGLPSDVQQSSDNRSITFPQINRTDTGGYYCEAGNPISKDSSDTYTVTVNYGPEDLSVALLLECSAESVPLPTYRWMHNKTDLNISQSILRIENVTAFTLGEYTCAVENSVTGSTHAISVNVVGRECFCVTESLHVTGAVIAGIASGAVLGVVLIISASVFLYKRFRSPVREEQTGSSVDRQNPSADYYNVALAGKVNKVKEDSSYMELQFKSPDTYCALRR